MPPKKTTKKTEEIVDEVVEVKKKTTKKTNPVDEEVVEVKKKTTTKKTDEDVVVKKKTTTKKTTPSTPESDAVYNGKHVIIVESPNKIKKITELLDKIKKHPNFIKCDFKVVASCGHIREIDKKNVGISLETFEPQYFVSDSKKHIVHDLKDEISDASIVSV